MRLTHIGRLSADKYEMVLSLERVRWSHVFIF
jgi:hypothetical protein